MDYKQSVVQNLPYPILDRIIEYAADFYTVSQVNSIYLARPKIGPYLQLTQVCHSWRLTMMQTLCRDCLLILTTSELCDIYGYRLWPVNEEFGKYPLDNMVKTVRLVFDYCLARSGQLLEKLALEPYKDLVFPSATTLKLVFSDCYECEYVDKHEDTEIALNYIKAIRKIVPNFETITVESKPNNTGLDGRVESAYQILPELFKNTKSSMFSLSDSAFMEYVDIPKYNSLTHLAFGGDIEDQRIIQLVQGNAKTLQTLEMRRILNGNIAELLKSNDGTDQVFPQLKKLHLRRKAMEQTPRRVETTKAVIFPSLKWICIDMPYPLGDDTFLRGNSNTLEYLDMQIDTECIDMLCSYNVFQAKRFKSLKHLKLRPALTGNDDNNNTDIIMPNNINLPMLLQSMSALPQRLCIDGFSVLYEVMASISHVPNMANLRILNIMNTQISLSQILDLLSRLPVIEELGLGYTANFGPMFSQVSLIDLPYFVSTRYSPMAPNLWKLNQCFDENEMPLEIFANYAILMKIICPTLTHIAVPDYIQKKYRKLVQNEIAKPHLQSYKKYLEILLRVIPKVGVRLI